MIASLAIEQDRNIDLNDKRVGSADALFSVQQEHRIRDSIDACLVYSGKGCTIS